MKSWEAKTLYVANLLVGGTGIVYAVMRILVDTLRRMDPQYPKADFDPAKVHVV